MSMVEAGLDGAPAQSAATDDFRAGTADFDSGPMVRLRGATWAPIIRYGRQPPGQFDPDPGGTR